jgi:hypothetical protein
LETSWITLREQGYQTLETLNEMGFVPNSDYFFNMEALTNSLFPKKIAHV